MITKEQVIGIIEEKIGESDFFIVEVNVRSGNRIEVLLDKESGMTIEACTEIHRHVVASLDPDKEDFELQVSSPGVGQPLKVRRQYTKNIGRTVNVKTSNGVKTEGILKSADELAIVLTTQVKEEVPGKKSKKLVDKDIAIPFADIIETKVVITFK